MSQTLEGFDEIGRKTEWDLTPPVVTTCPNRRYWLGLLFVPLATIVLVATGLGIYHAITLAAIPNHITFVAWALVTLLAYIWFIARDPENLTWTLTKKELRRGLDQDDLVIAFDEIESIIPGLPRLSSWSSHLGRILPGGQGAWHGSAPQQTTAFLLRLSGERCVLLDFSAAPQENGRALMEAFLQLNAAKIIGRKNDSEAGISKPAMATARVAAVDDFRLTVKEDKLSTQAGPPQNMRNEALGRAMVAV